MIPLFRPVIYTQGALDNLRDVFTREHLAEGPFVKQFETALEPFIGPVVTVNSCTSALELLAHCYREVKRSVGIVPQTCLATAAPFLRCGYEIEWIDVDPLTGVPNEETLADVDPDVLVVTAWGGRMPPVSAGGALVIVDSAHRMKPRHPDAEIAVYSFQAIKHLTTGDGGAISSDRAYEYPFFRKMRWFGLDRDAPGDRFAQDVGEVGFKFHMNDVAAAIGLANLHYLPLVLERAKRNARALYDGLTGTPFIELPPWDEDSTYWLFTVLSAHRDELRRYLAERNIESSEVHRRLDRLCAFHHVDLPEGGLPGLDYFSNRQLNIPCGAHVKPEEIDFIIESIRSWARNDAPTRRGRT